MTNNNTDSTHELKQSGSDHPRSPYGAGWPPPDDEISLFDIWDALVRRRWVIAGVFIAVTLIAGGYALTRPDISRYETVLQIGHRSVQGEEGTEREPIASPGATVAELEASFFPEAMQSVRGNDGGQGTVFESSPNVQARSDASTVTISLEGLPQHAEQYREILRSAAGLLIQAHAQQLETERSRLTRLRERLAGQRERTVNELDAVRGRVDRLTNAGDGTSSAVALRLDRLQERVNALQERLLDIDNEREHAADTLKGLSEYSDVFSRELPSNVVARQREASMEIAALTDGLRPTRLIATPTLTAGHVGTSGSLILALGAVLGGMLGIFAAFVAEFISAAQRRRKGSSMGGSTT